MGGAGGNVICHVTAAAGHVIFQVTPESFVLCCDECSSLLL